MQKIFISLLFFSVIHSMENQKNSQNVEKNSQDVCKLVVQARMELDDATWKRDLALSPKLYQRWIDLARACEASKLK